MQKTYIHEYPHPRVIVHYHPTSGEQLTLDHVRFALQHEVHAIELDLHYREDGQIVANHDSATPASPTLDQAIRHIVQHMHGDPTVNHDNYQFMLVLEPKEYDLRLFNGIIQILSSYTPYLSTAVSQGDPPRGMTVVITGEYVQDFSAQIKSSQRNQFCIVEGQDYSDEIINLSDAQIPFQWAQSIQHDRERGRINALHSGRDPHLRGTYNVRIWDCQAELSICLASGADAINADRDQVAALQQMISHQELHGEFPALSIQGSQVLLTWRGVASNSLYMALGTLDSAGLHFPRQILLTAFLDQLPSALAPTAALSPDNRLLIAYEGTDQQRLRYICGMFTSLDRCLIFDGQEHRLSLLNDTYRRGRNPAVAIGRDGRVIVVYAGTMDQTIWYVSGFLNAAGELIGQEYSLTEENARPGATPAIAIDAQNRVIVTYRGTDSETLWYVAGTIDDSGKIIGREFSLTEGEKRRGYAPSVAFSTHNRVILAYQGTDQETLWYVSGTLEPNGHISGREFSLTEGTARRGSHPTIASNAAGDIVIFYEGISEHKLWYVHGQLESSGRVIGQENALEIGMDRR